MPSDELIRRIVYSRLDTGQARPHLRVGFKHRDLIGWAREHRLLLVRSILTLVRVWVAAGRPGGGIRMGMFESWGHVVGGMLRSAGVEGLQQAIELYQEAPSDTEQTVTPFLRLWWEQHASERVGIKDLYEIAISTGSVESLLDVHLTERQRLHERGAGTRRGRQTRLGMALRRLSCQVFGCYRIPPAGTDHSGRQLYQLERVPEQCEQHPPN